MKSKRKAKDALQRVRLEEEDTASREGVAFLAGRLALFGFTCAAAFSLGVMLMVASWGKARAPTPKRTAQAGPA